LARLAGYRGLEKLLVIGAPGRIADIDQLARFEHVWKVEIRDCYDLGGEVFPGPEEMPSVEVVEIDGARVEEAKAIRERFAGSGVKLSIRGVRTAAWLRANVDNPFRGWDQSYPETVAKKAMGIYRKAATALGKLERHGSRAEVEAILHALVESFNRLDAKHSLDTAASEEIGDAFFELLRQTDVVGEATAEDWLAAWRNF
jgi:hypothetical protein